jgi:hypothetical protein
LITVKFTAQGSNSAFGNFAAGDLLRCAPDMAAHLVDVARVAVYADAPPPAAPAAAAVQTSAPAAPRRARKVK